MAYSSKCPTHKKAQLELTQQTPVIYKCPEGCYWRYSAETGAYEAVETVEAPGFCPIGCKGDLEFPEYRDGLCAYCPVCKWKSEIPVRE